MSEPTKASPQRARIIVVEPAAKPPQTIELLFNPTEYQVQKSNQYRDVENPGLGSPLIQFVSGAVETLSVDLIGDTTGTLKDVREEYVRKVRALMDPVAANHDPPVVEFTWGGFSFTGVIEKLNVTYQLFDPEGRPLRAKLSVGFKQYKTVSDQVRQANRTSPDVEKTYTVQRGDTLSSVAAAAWRDAELWRLLARANGIQDPRSLVPGTVLRIPKLDRREVERG